MLSNNMLTMVQAVSLIPNLKRPDEQNKNEQSAQGVGGKKQKTFSEILDEKYNETNEDIDVSTSGYDNKAYSIHNVIFMRDYTFQ